jgi:cell division transport system permease protein
MNFAAIRAFLLGTPAEERLLPEGRMAGPMPWVIAIMMFLTVLAAATGLTMSSAVRGLNADLSGRLTVQIVEPNPDKRDQNVKALVRDLPQLASVEAVEPLPDKEVEEMLKPWFGDGLLNQDLPVPALIDVTLSDGSPKAIAGVRQAVKAISPSSRVDEHAQWLAPLAELLGSLKWISILLVLLMAGAMSATVVLVARAALNTHRQTIEVMHLLGANDKQVAKLFQRRIAIDALTGSAVGLGFALIAMLILKYRFTALGSDLMSTSGPGWFGWLLIVGLPIVGAILATAAARVTVLRVLRTML